MGDQGEPSCKRLAGDEKVVWTDGCACSCELCSYLARHPRIFLIEGEDLETQAVNAGKVVVRALALERAVVQLMAHDG